MDTSETPLSELIPISQYIEGEFVPLSHLTHGWELHSAVALSPSEERAMVREPAQAVPAAIAERLGKLRVLMVPYLACLESGDAVSFTKPKGETHTAMWLPKAERINLVLASRELDPHDTGFEFLASVAELLRSKLAVEELESYARLLDEEVRTGVRGEIDEEALAVKRQLGSRTRSWHKSRDQFEHYRDVSFKCTLAEYMHGLWHDVQIRVGPDHLPVPQLRARMNLFAELFPPNPGYRVFAEELEKQDKA